MTLKCGNCGGVATAGEGPREEGRGQCLGCSSVASLKIPASQERRAPAPDDIVRGPAWQMTREAGAGGQLWLHQAEALGALARGRMSWWPPRPPRGSRWCSKRGPSTESRSVRNPQPWSSIPPRRWPTIRNDAGWRPWRLMPPRHQCLRETGAWVDVNARGQGLFKVVARWESR